MGRDDDKERDFLMPTRYVFVVLGFLGFNLVYAYKVVLSVVLVAMVNTTSAINDTSMIGIECSFANSSHNTIVDQKEGEFNWDSSQEANLLGSFFYGYIITQLPAGLMAEKLGAKWVFGTSLFIAALISLIGPLVARLDLHLFMFSRFCQGLCEGVAFPCMHVMLAQWLPRFERGFMSTIIYTGSMIGTVITLTLAGFLSAGDFLGGWPAIFYILGVAGVVWFIAWALLVFETPDSHPYITQKELTFIKQGQGDERIRIVFLS